MGDEGPDRIEPFKEDGMAWLHEVDRLEAALTQWAEANVPEWYLTTHGIHEPLVPTWELALGYLYQSKD